MNRNALVTLTGGGIIVLGALSVFAIKEHETFPVEGVVLAQAAQECSGEGLDFTPSQTTVTLVIEDGGDPTPIDCMMNTLQISSTLEEQIMSTTSLVGRQTAEDGDYTWSWSYSGFNGFSGTITPTD